MARKEKKQKIVNRWLLLLCVICIALMSCQRVLDSVTPSWVESSALKYVGRDPNQTIVSLATAKIIRTEIIVKNRNVLVDLKRLAEDNKYLYTDALAYIDTSISESQYVQDLAIGSEGGIGIAGVLAGLSGGSMIGLALKRRGDFSPQEHEAEIQKAKVAAVKENSPNSRPETS